MPKLVHETTPLGEAGASTSSTGRLKVQAISAGLGSSGYYSPDVLREAAKNELIKKGTPLFFDHATESEQRERPERSVRDIAAHFTGPAVYDEKAQALVGEIDVRSDCREMVTEMAPFIGLSISGSATDITEGDVDGRRVPIVEGLAAIDSVDLVTRAGRGGMFLLESARPSKVNARAIEHGVTEATVNDTREALQQLLRDAYGGEKTWVWVRDFDESTVWFEVENGEDSGIFGQSYTQTDSGAVELQGDRGEVRVVTTYVSTTRSDSNNPPTEETTEVTMGTIQVDEAEHRRVTEEAGRVATLESERDTEKARADKAEGEIARRDRVGEAEKIISEKATAGEVSFNALESDGLLAKLPVTEAGELDKDAFGKTVDAAVEEKKTADAKAREAAGEGRVRTFGKPRSGNADGISEAEFNEALGIKKIGA